MFGAGGAGKSELLQALAGARLPPAAAASGEGLTALAQVERERDRARTQPACGSLCADAGGPAHPVPMRGACGATTWCTAGQPMLELMARRTHVVCGLPWRWRREGGAAGA